MKHKRNHLPIVFTALFGMLFLSLLFIRMGIFDRQPDRLEIADIMASLLEFDSHVFLAAADSLVRAESEVRNLLGFEIPCAGRTGDSEGQSKSQ